MAACVGSEPGCRRPSRRRRAHRCPAVRSPSRRSLRVRRDLRCPVARSPNHHSLRVNRLDLQPSSPSRRSLLVKQGRHCPVAQRPSRRSLQVRTAHHCPVQQRPSHRSLRATRGLRLSLPSPSQHSLQPRPSRRSLPARKSRQLRLTRILHQRASRDQHQIPKQSRQTLDRRRRAKSGPPTNRVLRSSRLKAQRSRVLRRQLVGKMQLRLCRTALRPLLSAMPSRLPCQQYLHQP